MCKCRTLFQYVNKGWLGKVKKSPADLWASLANWHVLRHGQRGAAHLPDWVTQERSFALVDARIGQASHCLRELCVVISFFCVRPTVVVAICNAV